VAGVCIGSEDTASCIDRFKCYKAKPPKGQRFAKVPALDVSDALEPDAVFGLVKPALACTAVDKNGAGVLDQAAHMVCFQMKYARTDPPQDKFSLGAAVSVNEFGDLQGQGDEALRIKTPKLLCLPATRDNVALARPFDAFKCHNAGTRPGSPKFAAPPPLALEDSLIESTVTLKKPSFFCGPASVDGAALVDPVPHLECYKGKEAPGHDTEFLALRTELGGQLLEVGKFRVLCIPSVVAD
jgi:hypothetical protein